MGLDSLLASLRRRSVAAEAPGPWSWRPGGHPERDDAERAALHYANRDARLGIDFRVERLPFAALQVMDPRLVRIEPGACNEKHRHAHESIFVVLAGKAEILIGSSHTCLQTGDVAYVPRWVVHQTRNCLEDQELLLLAITDFGLTSAVLGDYDARTRLKGQGDQAFCSDPVERPLPSA